MYSMDAQVSPVNQIQCRGPLWVSLLHGFYSVQDLTFGVSVLIVYRFLRCLTNQLLSFFASVWRPPNKIWFYFSRLTPCFRISPVLSAWVGICSSLGLVGCINISTYGIVFCARTISVVWYVQYCRCGGSFRDTVAM